jgi:hypothetical protein
MKEIHANISRGAQQEKDIGDQTLLKDQHKWKCVYHGLMVPSTKALNHLAADMLLKFSMKGCPIKTGPKWTPEMWNVALAKGAHPLAMDPVASQQLQKESLEKAEQGFCQLVPWDANKADPPRNLKISPISAIPHKS